MTMIAATLYFEIGVDAGGLVKDLQKLPEAIRPVYFAADEGKVSKSNILSDRLRFEKFMKKHPLGFFLYSKSKTLLNLSTGRVGYAEVTLWLEAGPPDTLVSAFMRALVGRKPVFGFACAEDEYKHRNRHYITLGENHIESWIGRRVERYIPGVYWYTLLSDGLLAKHGVALTELAAEVVASEAVGDGSLHLLKFFEQPEQWEAQACRLDALCARVKGVFSRGSVDTAVTSLMTYLEFSDAMAQWP